MKRLRLSYILLAVSIIIGIILLTFSATNYNQVKKYERDLANRNMQNWHTINVVTNSFELYNFEGFKKDIAGFSKDAIYSKGKVNAISNQLLPEFEELGLIDFTYVNLLDLLCSDELSEKEQEKKFKLFMEMNTDLKELSHYIVFGDEASKGDVDRQILLLSPNSELNKDVLSRVEAFGEKYSFDEKYYELYYTR